MRERSSDLMPGEGAILDIIEKSRNDFDRELARHAELVKSRLAWIARRLEEQGLIPEIETSVTMRDGSRVIVKRPLLDVTGSYHHDPYYLDPLGKVYRSYLFLWQGPGRARKVPVLQEELDNLGYINHAGEFLKMIEFIIAPS